MAFDNDVHTTVVTPFPVTAGMKIALTLTCDETDPGVGNDFNAGYRFGSLWYNRTVGQTGLFMCTDPAPGAAVWREITLVAP